MLHRSPRAWSPKDLFKPLSAGDWWDGRDINNMFQDIAATTPVAAINDPIGSWAGKVNNNKAIQATAGLRPLYTAFGPLSAEASSKYLSVGTLHRTFTASTLYALVVTRSISFSASYRRMLVIAGAAASDFDNVGSAALFIRDNATGNINSFRNSAGLSTVAYSTALEIHETVFDGTNNTAYLNGVAGTPVASSGAFNATRLFMFSNTVPDIYSTASFGDVVIIDRVPTPQERNNLLRYVKEKWRI